jgi:hypothetical protein
MRGSFVGNTISNFIVPSLNTSQPLTKLQMPHDTMDDTALLFKPRWSPNPSGVIQQLCLEWQNAWADLSACTWSKDPSSHANDISHLRESFFRRVYALVDLPSMHHHKPAIDTVEERLTALLKRFPPPHVPLAREEFRLIRFQPKSRDGVIKVSLVNMSLNDIGDDFTAVSYCWGPPTQPQKVILVNGRPLVIFEALLTLLSHFQTFASGYYWIDAICIRQDDVLEKNTQIPLMTRIYSAPRAVDIWLGPDQDDSAHVLELAHQKTVDAQASVRFLRGLDRLLKREWFRRVWVLQEVVLAKPDAPVLRSGFATCAWDEFVVIPDDIREDDSDLAKSIAAHDRELNVLAKAPAFIHMIDEREDESMAEMDARLAVLQRNLAIMQAHRPKREAEVEWLTVMASLRGTLIDIPVHHVRDLRESYRHENENGLHLLHQLLWRTKSQMATNPRDKIYGLLGILRDFPIVVDYHKPVHQVFCEATSLAIAETTPTGFAKLMYSRPVLGVSTQLHPQLVSWALDFSHTHSDWAEHLADDPFQADGVDSDTDSAISADPAEPLVKCELESLEFRVNASEVDVIVQMLECSDVLIGDSLPDSDAQDRQLLRYLARLQCFHESHTSLASAWNPQVDEGLFGIIKQLPNNGVATFTQEERAREYAVLVAACENVPDSEPAASESDDSQSDSSQLDSSESDASELDASEADASGPDDSDQSISEAATLEDVASEADDIEDEEQEASLGEAAESRTDEHLRISFASVLYDLLITTSVHRTSFFVTRQGLCGLCMPGAKIGDTIAVLFYGDPECVDVPFVVRPRDDGRYSMVTVAWVQAEWENLARFRGTLDPHTLVFR